MYSHLKMRMKTISRLAAIILMVALSFPEGIGKTITVLAQAGSANAGGVTGGGGSYNNSAGFTYGGGGGNDTPAPAPPPGSGQAPAPAAPPCDAAHNCRAFSIVSHAGSPNGASKTSLVARCALLSKGRGGGGGGLSIPVNTRTTAYTPSTGGSSSDAVLHLPDQADTHGMIDVLYRHAVAGYIV